MREIALGGKKEDFGRGINKYVNTFSVEEDSSKEGFIPDRRSKESDINCFEARILVRDEILLFLSATKSGEKTAIRGL